MNRWTRIARRCRNRGRWFIHRSLTPHRGSIWIALDRAAMAIALEDA